MDNNNFSVAFRTVGDLAVIYPNGYLNNIVGESLEKKCSSCLEQGISKIVLNFENVEFINSIGISILLGIMDMMRQSKGRLCFTDLGALHRETFDVLGLGKHMQIFDTEQEAIEHLRQGD